MLELIGHFHPLLVHLPIGVLLLAGVFHILDSRNPEAGWRKPLLFAVVAGMITALFSCLTGYTLSLIGDYDAGIVGKHQNIALLTTAISLGWYYALAVRAKKIYQHGAALAVLLGLVFTGHLGGTLTHGEGYLSLGGSTTASEPRKPIADIQHALVYKDLVEPLFREKCYSCHGSAKQKGKLRLDGKEVILKGGEDGEIVTAGNAEKSELIRRLLLAKDHKEHMPPKEKAQLTKAEIEVLQWWVQSGLSFDKTVADLHPAASINSSLQAFAQPAAAATGATAESSFLPELEVPAADPAALQALQQRGIVVVPYTRSTHYVYADLLTVENLTAKDLELLLPIRNQLLAVNLSGQPVDDAGLQVLAKLTSLRQLQLQRTAITDKGIAMLGALQELQQLNLAGTDITTEGLAPLAALKKLNRLFLYQTKVNAAGYATLARQFPTARIDTGNYAVPTLASDTQLVEKK